MAKRVFLVLVCLVAYAGFSSADKAHALRIQVEIENFASGQGFQSPVIAAGSSVGVYGLGLQSPPLLDMLAEGGVCANLVNVFKQRGAQAVCHQGTVVFGRSGLIADLPISVSGAFLTVLARLSVTNDGFTGVQSLWVPTTLVKGVWYFTEIKAYDAGGEFNDELCTHLISPSACGFSGQGYSSAPEPNQENRVQYHPGLHGQGNLTAAVNNFGNPVGRIRYRIVE